MTQTNAVALAPQKSVVPSEHEMMVFQTMAKQAVGSKLYRGIGDEFAVMTVMLAARELDIPPMAALNGGINIINGKTEISARMMAALIMRRGNTLRTIESTNEMCTLEGIRADNGEKARETFTIEEAKQAGLVKVGGGWQKWPKDMCYARCMSRLARRLFPDVIGMGYIEGEIRESSLQPIVESTIEVSDVEAAQTIEQAVQNQEELLAKFLSQFDKEEARWWAEYVSQLREKLDLKISDIVAKYDEDPAKATEKFKSWLAKQSSKA